MVEDLSKWVARIFHDVGGRHPTKRIDTPLLSDTRTVGQREGDRFVAVARHVLDYLVELTQARKPAV